MATSSSVVVVSHRPGTWLAECLTSALPQASEVIVVDNGSPGEEASDIARRAGAIAIRSRKNLGFAGGVNLGLGKARGEIIGLLNDDAVAGEGWLEAARSVLDDPTVAAVTPKVVLGGLFAEVVLDDETWLADGDHRPLGRLLRSVLLGDVEVMESLVGAGVHDCERSVIEGRPSIWRWTTGREPFYIPLAGSGGAGSGGAGSGGAGSDVADPDGAGPGWAGTVRVNGEPVEVRSVCRLLNHAGNYLERHGIAGDYGMATPDDGRFDEAAERFGFSGTAPVIRAETLTLVGQLATPFFAYNEDTDWCLRARLAGLRIVYDPGASVVHRLSATSGGPAAPFVRFLAQRNALLCLARNAPPDVARRFLWRRMREGSGDGVRRAVIKKLPWALASRIQNKKKWVMDPHDVWDRWAGADTTWDTRPAQIPSAQIPPAQIPPPARTAMTDPERPTDADCRGAV